MLLRGAYLHVLWSLRFRRRGSVDLADCELAGAYAASVARRDPAWHTWTLGFIDMLVWLGSGGDGPMTPASVVAPPRACEEEIATPRSWEASRRLPDELLNALARPPARGVIVEKTQDVLVVTERQPG